MQVGFAPENQKNSTTIMSYVKVTEVVLWCVKNMEQTGKLQNIFDRKVLSNTYNIRLTKDCVSFALGSFTSGLIPDHADWTSALLTSKSDVR